MKKALMVLIALCFVASFAFAQSMEGAAATASPTTEATMTIQGTIIDNMCAGAHKDDLAEFIKTHPKSCALQCATSGYNIYSDGKLMKFDKESNAKIEEFLKKEDSKLDVEVVAKKNGEELSLVSISNQK